MIWALTAGAAALALTASAAPEAETVAPYEVASNLFQPDRPDLGLKRAPGTQTFTVFAPTSQTDGFSNGVVRIPFKGRLYAQWQSSARDEDSADTWVASAPSRAPETCRTARPIWSTRPTVIVRACPWR